MGNYFRQIYTGSHAEWWTTVFNPRRQEKQWQSFRPPWVNTEGVSGWREGGGRAASGVKGRLGH